MQFIKSANGKMNVSEISVTEIKYYHAQIEEKEKCGADCQRSSRNTSEELKRCFGSLVVVCGSPP